MRLNISFKNFKKNLLKKKHQILFVKRKCTEYKRVENLFKFLLAEKNSFLFESVEKGKIRGRYTIIGLNPDKIWDINKNKITTNFNGKKTTIKIKYGTPLKHLQRVIKEKYRLINTLVGVDNQWTFSLRIKKIEPPTSSCTLFLHFSANCLKPNNLSEYK